MKVFTFPIRKPVRLWCGFGPFLSSNLVATCRERSARAREKSDVWRSTTDNPIIIAIFTNAVLLSHLRIRTAFSCRSRNYTLAFAYDGARYNTEKFHDRATYVLKLVSHCDRHARFMALPTERVARSPVGTASRPATARPSMNDDDRRKPVRPATTVVISRLPRCRHVDIDCRLLFIGIPVLGWHALTLVALKFQCLSVTVPKSLRGWRAVRLCRPLLRAVFR